MHAVQTDFATRAEEVTRYFSFLRNFHEECVVISTPPTGGPLIPPHEKAALFKTLKANGFLLLYNLIESTVKNAIEAIFDEFKSKGISFDACRQEVRKIVLANLRRHNVDKIAPALSSISLDIVVETFRKRELFSGNIDARRIREVADEYGFRRPNAKSNELLTVKENRNSLAHGDKSFAEVGRDYDVERLETIQTEVVEFLQELLVNVAEYISSGSYLAR